MHRRPVEAEMGPQAVVEKVLLLPEIELFAELALQAETRVGQMPGGINMELGGFTECDLVKWPPPIPGCPTPRPKVLVPEILHPDQTFRSVMEINGRDMDTRCGEKACDFDVMPVLLFLARILHQNDWTLLTGANAIEFAAGTSLFQRSDFNRRPMYLGNLSCV